jgi:hypothetical protein
VIISSCPSWFYLTWQLNRTILFLSGTNWLTFLNSCLLDSILLFTFISNKFKSVWLLPTDYSFVLPVTSQQLSA